MGEEAEIVIVGAGICGLATALAFHRKGVTSLVLEKSKTLRSMGAGVAIQANGWCALDQLGVGSKLRLICPLVIQETVDIDLQSGRHRRVDASVFGEARCLKRSDLINVLADELPCGTIRFESEVISVKIDAITTFPVIQLSNGRTIKAKVVIGCDGSNSAVANFLELKPKKALSMAAVRGFTNYPNGHGFPPRTLRIKRDGVLCGTVPVDDKLVFWFVVQNSYPKDSNVSKDPKLIKQYCVESLNGFPKESIELAENCDITSLYLSRIRYVTPMNVCLEKFRRGTVTVAGDSMHLMGPFLGQGASAALEDAVVLGRCLGEKIKEALKGREIEEVIDQYINERRMRLFLLSSQTYLVGLMLETPSVLVKVVIIVILLVLFRNQYYHTQYDCGRLKNE